MLGFIIFDDFFHCYGEFFSQMSAWLRGGKIRFREDIVYGLENAPQAFIGLLEGKTSANWLFASRTAKEC